MCMSHMTSSNHGVARLPPKRVCAASEGRAPSKVLSSRSPRFVVLVTRSRCNATLPNCRPVTACRAPSPRVVGDTQCCTAAGMHRARAQQGVRTHVGLSSCVVYPEAWPR